MDCPTCGESFDSEQGMRIHHSHKHSERLPNRTCKGCEAEFYDPKSRLEFCDECDPNSGENNGNWKGAKEKSECKLCESEFSYYPSDKDGIYCPECVDSASGLLPENPAIRERIVTDCLHCGSEIEACPSRTKDRKRGVFCDLECYGAWLSENVVGETHHQWEGGTLDYGRKWWQVRREALERDNYACQNCGKTADEIGRNPDVHHLERVRDFDRPQEAHALKNVIALCRSCHRNAEAGNIEVAVPSAEK
ncbi:HNH endonuclease [Halorussus litoreus]|uniref:HNH endonuclease n=1 Tax=Halorussus litoreus TaxID=1710536 RepID=UPI000E250857|nr:HNH endonuclease [Halorussus litoreus]